MRNHPLLLQISVESYPSHAKFLPTWDDYIKQLTSPAEKYNSFESLLFRPVYFKYGPVQKKVEKLTYSYPIISPIVLSQRIFSNNMVLLMYETCHATIRGPC
jgi:hypothetical protein